jgi:hypothetical protein
MDRRKSVKIVKNQNNRGRKSLLERVVSISRWGLDTR